MPAFHILASFNGSDAYPYGDLTTDANGDLFGITSADGAYVDTIFEIEKTGTGYATEPTIIFTSQYQPDVGTLIAESNGDLIEAADETDPSGAPEGVVFAVVKDGDGYASNPVTLASFDDDSISGLTTDTEGDLFGVASNGDVDGTVFEIAKTSGGYASAPTTIASSYIDGGPLVADADGNLFGVMSAAVVEIAKTQAGYASTPTTIASLDGLGQDSALTIDANGDLFVMSEFGAISEVAREGSGYATEPIALANFSETSGNIAVDANGDVFGATFNDGADKEGAVFEVAKTSAGYATTPTTIIDFDGPNGDLPEGGVTTDASGDVFGTTALGGAHDDGAVFEIEPNQAARAELLLSAPDSVTLTQGGTLGIYGVSIDDTDATANESFTITLSDTAGLLSATGTGVSGAGTMELVATGSLSDVNADLSTLTDTDPDRQPDTITIDASDSAGDAATPDTIAVAVNGPLVLTSPTSVTAAARQATAITGISISESGAASSEVFAVSFTALSGELTVTPGDADVIDNGTNSLEVDGSLSNVNAALATLTDTEQMTGSDTIFLAVAESLGSTAQSQIAVAVRGALQPAISAPTSTTVTQGQATPLGPVSLSEPGSTADETFTVTLTDATGVLSATGAGVTGSGTTTLIVAGSLNQINSDLATATDDEPVAEGDTLTIAATDSLGGVASPATVQVATAPALSGALTLTTVSEGVVIASPTPVADFSDSNPADVAADFSAVINWGDDTTSAGTVTGADGSFVVTPDAQGHVYQAMGSQPLTVNVAGPLGSRLAISGGVEVTDVLTAETAPDFAPIEGEQYSGTIATFGDSFAGNHAGDFSAVIDWGDGSAPTPGEVTYDDGQIAVSGTHTFPDTPGSVDAATITLSDTGGATATATANATVAPQAVEPLLTASSGQLIDEGDNQYVLNLGDVTEGDTPELVALSITNQGVDPLSGDFAVTAASGVFSGGFDPVSDLADGASAVAGYAVVDTSTPGAFSETVTVAPAEGSAGELPPETILVEGNVTPPPLPPALETAPDLPVPDPTTASNSLGDAAISPTTVDFGNVPLGSNPEQPITVTNRAQPPGNQLDASVGDVTGDATGSGSITDLGPSRSDSDDIQVGINTSSVGEKSGTITIDMATNGSGPVDVFNVPLDFKTTNQSVSALGGTVVLSSGSISGSATVNVPPFSLSASGSASNTLSASANLDPGTITVDYPVQAGADLPTGFQPGEGFTVDTGTLGYGNLSLNTTTTNLASASLTDHISVGLNGDAVLPSIDYPFVSTDPFNASLTQDLGVGVGVGFSSNSVSYELEPTPFSLSLGLPGAISTSTAVPGASTTELPALQSEGASDSFLKASGDILQILALLAPELKALDVDLPDDLGKVELLAENVSIGLAIKEEFVFDPTGVDVSISPNFDPSDVETGELGDSFTFDPPADWDQPVVLTTSYSLVGTLEAQASLVAQVEGELEGGVLKVTAGKFLGFPIDVNIGPVFSVKLGEFEVGSGLQLQQSDTALGGFNTIQQQYTIPVASGTTGQSGAIDLPSQTIAVLGNVVLPTATADGCPHFTTFDGLHFDFQGAGEFVAARSTQPGNTFQVQMRIEPEFGPDSAVSIITEIAIQVGTDRLTFVANRNDVVWIDGGAASISQANPVLQLSGGSVTEISNNDYRVVLNTGEVVTVNPFGDGMGFSAALGSNDGPGSVQGFLGADEGQSKDFQLPDGTVLQQPLTQAQLYQTFADAWRVTDATSLLDYGPGQSTATFTNTQYPREILTLADLPQDLVTQAAALATAAGITDPTVAADAEFDYITMGNPSYFTEDAAVAGSNASASTSATITEPAAPPPSVGTAPADPTLVETSGATTPVTFVTNLTSPATTDTIVDYTAVAPGSTDGKQFFTAADFGGTLPSGQVTIVAGQTEADVTIDVPNSALGSAPSKWLMVNVTSPSGALVYDAEGQTEILNSEPTAGALAQPSLELLTGASSSSSAPTLTANGNDYTLDLGTLPLDSASEPIQLAFVNEAAPGADSLRSETSSDLGSGFTFSGTELPSVIAAGDAYQGLYVQPDTATAGTQSETLTLTSDDVNDTGYAGSLPDTVLTVTDTVVPTTLPAGLTDMDELASNTLEFGQATATLRVHGLSGASTIDGMQFGDAVDFVGITGVTLDGDTLGAPGGGTIDLQPAPTGYTYQLYGDASGGTELWLDPAAAPIDAVSYTDTATNTNGQAGGTEYQGPVDYLQRQYIYDGTDPVAMVANVPNMFLKGGPADDALQVTAGNNVLDGGGGSSFLVGGTGADGGLDTFFIDARDAAPVWDTIVNFHEGDQATIFGFQAGVSTMPITVSDGAVGYTGATIHSEINGPGTGITASVTFAGISAQTIVQQFAMTTGNLGGTTPYLLIQYR